MEQVTVGPKYQIVIPKKVRNKMHLKPGQKVGIRQVDKNTITVKIADLSWVKRTAGILADELKGIDTTKYMDDLRNEWERKI